jgi:hypothetical protein
LRSGWGRGRTGAEWPIEAVQMLRLGPGGSMDPTPLGLAADRPNPASHEDRKAVFELLPDGVCALKGLVSALRGAWPPARGDGDWRRLPRDSHGGQLRQMRVPFVLLLVSLAGVAAALGIPGLTDLLLLAGPCALASLFLLLRAGLAGRPPEPTPGEHVAPDRGLFRRRPVPPPAAPRLIVVDGSNVMYWKDETPQIETLREVLARLAGLGFTPGVVFDANAGHLVAGQYLHDPALALLIGLPRDRVMVVDKGTQADAVVLAAARDQGTRIVSNDRFRDWADRHPEVHEPGHLVRGGYRDGRLWLDLDDADARATGAAAGSG